MKRVSGRHASLAVSEILDRVASPVSMAYGNCSTVLYVSRHVANVYVY